jgi:hypothetical protein
MEFEKSGLSLKEKKIINVIQKMPRRRVFENKT